MPKKLKIICPECASQAELATVKNISTKEALLQCYCNNVECGHTFALMRAFSHTLSDSLIKTPASAEKESYALKNKTTYKVICPACCELATIKRTNRKHVLISDLYCTCNNKGCRYRFVSNLSFSHSISPSADKHGRLIHDLINSISPAEREKAIEFLRQASQELKVK